MSSTPKPMLLIVLDGWGYNAEAAHNAIASANAPFWNELWNKYPHTLLSASGLDVGLPTGQMGNSEVGHMNLGAGRVVYQNLTLIDKAIDEGTFFQNKVLAQAFTKCATGDATLHLMGLVSPGGIHSHQQHLYALIQMAQQFGVEKIAIHAFLDGRDTPPQSALNYIDALEAKLHEFKIGHIASVSGRYYAMDRDKRWDRTEKVYNMLTNGEAAFQASTARTAIEMAYERGENDEFVQPTLVHEAQQHPSYIHNNDSIVFFNFRSDRARQLSSALLLDEPAFTGFTRKQVPQLQSFVSMAEYAKDLPTQIAFPSINLNHVFGEWLAEHGKKQLRIAETEKYAHVTFFFNGGREAVFSGEDRILVPSPQVATYDLKPEMSANEVCDKLNTAILSQKYDAIICNFANADMLGHTGNFAATMRAIETIDHCLQKIVSTCLQVGGEIIITADHGNAEQMFDAATHQPHTAHTSLHVPCIYIGRKAEFIHTDGVLADVAPTLLSLMGLAIPAEMTGKQLLKLL